MIKLLALLWALPLIAMQSPTGPQIPELRQHACSDLVKCRADHSKSPECIVDAPPVEQQYTVICGDEDGGDMVEPFRDSRPLPDEMKEDLVRWLCGYEDLS